MFILKNDWFIIQLNRKIQGVLVYLKKSISISFLIFLTFFSIPEKGFAKTKQLKHIPSKVKKNRREKENLRYSKKINHTSSSKEKILQKKTKKETNKTDLFSVKTIKNFTINIPSSWQCIDDSTQLPENVAVVFISNKSNNGSLTPTINVSTETTQLNQEHYVFEALKYHNSQEGNLQSYVFDILPTPSGASHVLRSERLTQFGEVTFLQGILVNKQKAYVITGSATKEQFGFLFPVFLKAISSFSLQEVVLEKDYFSSIQNLQ